MAFPFNGRILVPFLATFISNDLLFDFVHLNLIFSILSVIVLFLLWKKLKLSNILIFIGMFWLLFHWSGMVRLNAFDPLTVDVPLYLFQGLLVLIIFTGKYNWLLLLTPIAMLQKESFLAYLIVLSIYALLHNRFYEKLFPIKIILVAVLLGFATNLLINYYFPPVEEGLNSFLAVLFYIKEVIVHPFSILRWLAAIFVAFGGFIFLTCMPSKQYKYSAETNVLTWFACLSLTLGIIAGGDFTRIIFLGFPFIMTWILLRIRHQSVVLVFITFLLSLYVMKLHRHIPLPNGSLNTHQWFPEYAETNSVLIVLAIALAYFIVIRGTHKLLN